MKKLVIVLLAVLLLCGTACAGELTDLWEIYTGEEFYDCSNYGFKRVSPRTSQIDNAAIGSFGNYILNTNDHYYTRNESDFLSALLDYSYMDRDGEMLINISTPDSYVSLTDTELYSWADRYGDVVINEEYYRFDFELDERDYGGFYTYYDVLVKCYSEADGGEVAEYVFISEYQDRGNSSSGGSNYGGGNSSGGNYGGSNYSSGGSYGGSTNTGRGKSMYIVNCNKATMYEKPYYWANSIGSIPYGKTLDDITYNGGGFAYGCYNGRYGHVMVEYLSDDNPNVSQVTEEQKANKGQGKTMVIVNCEEWVSLREKPYYWADRLKKVPLGAYFTDITYNGGGFAYGCYDGTYGYIMVEYLRDIR